MAVLFKKSVVIKANSDHWIIILFTFIYGTGPYLLLRVI